MARPTCPRPREICATRSTCRCWSMTSPRPHRRDRSGTRRPVPGKARRARRQSAAEARARARRCPTCGGVVPAGMSLCNTCGLNLETGQRVDLDEDLAPAPVIRTAGTPMGVSIIGGLGFLGSIILAVDLARPGGQGGGRDRVPPPGAGLRLRHLCLGPVPARQIGQAHADRALAGRAHQLVAMIALPIFVAYSRGADRPQGTRSRLRRRGGARHPVGHRTARHAAAHPGNPGAGGLRGGLRLSDVTAGSSPLRAARHPR